MRTEMTSVNLWIGEHALKLRQRLALYSDLDEDAFQDAYLDMAEAYRTPQTKQTLEIFFIKAYKRISGKHLGEAYTTVRPDELFFTLLPSEEAEPMEREEETEEIAPIVKRITDHIRRAFPVREVTAFEMWIKGFSCRDISDTLGMGRTAIGSARERIIQGTRLLFPTRI